MMKDWNVYVDFHITMEEGTSLFKSHTTCSVYVPDLDDALVIGEADIYLINLKKSAYEDICGEAAILSSHLSQAVNQLEQFCEVENINGSIAMMQSLHIHEDWRLKGLEEAFISKLLAQLSYFNVELFTFIPMEKHNGLTSDHFSNWDMTYIDNGDGNPLWYTYLSRQVVPSE